MCIYIYISTHILKHNLNLKGWNSQLRRERPRRDNLKYNNVII